MTDAKQFLGNILADLKREEDATRPVLTATPKTGHRRLCIGMSTFNDFDGVWFTIQAVRAFHPEVVDQINFLVVDNHPEGAEAADLRHLHESIPNCRYFPFRGYNGTAVREFVFREAEADIVCCVDSHVMLVPGALAALLAYFDDRPDCLDIVQGPLLSEDLERVDTHFAPTWRGNMFGIWAHDDAVEAGEPFEIPMQGLGVFACRKAAWPGLNPRLRGFGGEEGYLHERFRQQGGRAICLPQLRWIHRFRRPAGVPYRLQWRDMIRNYLVGWGEVGWDRSSISAYFREYLADGSMMSVEQAAELIADAEREADNPFMYFDAIFCLNLDTDRDRWHAIQKRFARIGIDWRVERVTAIATPDNHHSGCTQSWRAMVAAADDRGLANVLVFEDDAMFHDDTLDVMTRVVAELGDVEWDLCYLGACVWGAEFDNLPGSDVLQAAGPVTCTHALAVNRRAFGTILEAIPTDADGLDAFLHRYAAIDQYFSQQIRDGALKAVIVTPRVATQPWMLQYADSDLSLAPWFTNRPA